MYLAGHGPGDDGAAGSNARLAQSVEHAAVNRSVVGSSPTTSAIEKSRHFCINLQDAGFFLYLPYITEREKPRPRLRHL